MGTMRLMITFGGRDEMLRWFTEAKDEGLIPRAAKVGTADSAGVVYVVNDDNKRVVLRPVHSWGVIDDT